MLFALFLFFTSLALCSCSVSLYLVALQGSNTTLYLLINSSSCLLHCPMIIHQFSNRYLGSLQDPCEVASTNPLKNQIKPATPYCCYIKIRPNDALRSTRVSERISHGHHIVFSHVNCEPEEVHSQFYSYFWYNSRKICRNAN